MARDHQPLGERPEQIPSQPSEGAKPANTTILDV